MGSRLLPQWPAEFRAKIRTPCSTLQSPSITKAPQKVVEPGRESSNHFEPHKEKESKLRVANQSPAISWGC